MRSPAACHQGHPHRGEDDEDVELAGLRALPAGVVERLQEHQAHPEADHQVEEDGEAVQDHHALEGALVGAPEVQRDHQRAHDPRQAHHAHVLLALARGQEIEDEEHQRGDGEHQHRPDGREVDGRGHEGGSGVGGMSYRAASAAVAAALACTWLIRACTLASVSRVKGAG